jgi:hypothetical protein
MQLNICRSLSEGTILTAKKNQNAIANPNLTIRKGKLYYQNRLKIAIHKIRNIQSNIAKLLRKSLRVWTYLTEARSARQI